MLLFLGSIFSKCDHFQIYLSKCLWVCMNIFFLKCNLKNISETMTAALVLYCLMILFWQGMNVNHLLNCYLLSNKRFFWLTKKILFQKRIFFDVSLTTMLRCNGLDSINHPCFSWRAPTQQVQDNLTHCQPWTYCKAGKLLL